MKNNETNSSSSALSKKSPYKKLLRRKYLLTVYLIPLFIIGAFVFIFFTQENTYDPINEEIIRKCAVWSLWSLSVKTMTHSEQDPNKLTDEDFAKITDLDLHWEPQKHLSDIRMLKKFTNLKSLSLSGATYPETNIPQWKKFLVKLGVYDLNEDIALDLKPLKNHKNLQSLTIAYTPVKSIKPISSLINLKYLRLDSISVSDLEPIEGLKNLQGLSISRILVTDLEPLKALTNLKSLWIEQYDLTNLEPIKGLKKLEILQIGLTQAPDLEPIRNLTNLKELWINDTQLNSLDIIKGLPNLQKLYIARNKGITDKQEEELKKVMPNLKIEYYGAM